MARAERARENGQAFGFEARCAWCGPVSVPRDGLRVFVSGRGAGLFEFVCPDCGHENFRPLSLADLEALAAVGVRPARGHAPFELLEERSGPPIGWDDLIDFHTELAVESSGLPRIDGRRGQDALERDAA